MQITRIPAQRENKKTKKTRIAVYCRVSTKMEEQEDSLETQQAVYTNLISMRSDWELVGIYSDKSFRTKRREAPGVYANGQ